MGGGEYAEISILIDGWLWNAADLEPDEDSDAPEVTVLVGAALPDDELAARAAALDAPTWLAL